MFFELFTALTTPCPQYVRHMEYLSEVIAMRGRHRRNEASWRPHLERTRHFILSAAERCRSRNKLVVIGAGLLLDLPLAELSSLFQEVVLLDIVFLREVRRVAGKFGNVRLVLHDATNVAQKLHENIHRGMPELPRATPVFAEIDENTDLVVSLNIFSQLWVMPRAYILKKLRGIDEEELDDWCRQLVESHFVFLQLLPCQVVLVGDYLFTRQNKEGRIVGQGSTVFHIPLPEPDVSWTWHIIPLGEEGRHLSKDLTVGGWLFRF